MPKVSFQTTKDYQSALAYARPGDAQHGRIVEHVDAVPKRGDEVVFGATVWVVDSVVEPHSPAESCTVIVLPTGKASGEELP